MLKLRFKHTSLKKAFPQFSRICKPSRYRSFVNKKYFPQINGATGEQITFGEMAQKIANISSSLSRLGVQQGDVVAICSENRIEYLLTSLAVFYSGAIITFFNNAYTKGITVHFCFASVSSIY